MRGVAKRKSGVNVLQADRAPYPEVLRGSELGMLEEETGGLSEPREAPR